MPCSNHQAATDAIDAYTSGAGKTALVGIEQASSGGSYGVWARTSDPTGAGVKGTNIGGTGGVGLYGTGDIGVFGTSSTGNNVIPSTLCWPFDHLIWPPR